MNIFSIKNNKLSVLKEKPFKLEKEIQNLFELNLFSLMGLELVKSEFFIRGKRIDTLAYDYQSKSFVIIEYKREKNISVIDQGFSYLGLMLENRADFVLSYNETLSKSIHSSSIDWTQTRVAFVSTSFTENQISATNFKDLAIELWEIKRYEKDLICIQEIKKTKSATSIKPLTQNDKNIKSVTDVIKVYTEQDHLNGKSNGVIELYESFRDAILNLPSQIEMDVKKSYIAFKVNRNVVDIEVQAHSLKIWINLKKGQLDDPLNLMRDVSTLRGHNGNGDYELTIRDNEQFDYIMILIKQAINNYL